MGDRFTRTDAPESRGPRIMRSDFEVREKSAKTRSRSRSEENTVESSRWARGSALGGKKGGAASRSRSSERVRGGGKQQQQQQKAQRQLRKARSRSGSRSGGGSGSSGSDDDDEAIKRMKQKLKKKARSRSTSPLYQSRKQREKAAKLQKAMAKLPSSSSSSIANPLSSFVSASSSSVPNPPVKASPIVQPNEKKMAMRQTSPSRSRSRSRSNSRSNSRSVSRSRSGSRSRSRSPSEAGPAKLPIHACKKELMEMIAANQVCVITGDTGCGKSTQLAQFLFEAGYHKQGMIAITQPRRLGAVSLAKRVSLEMGTELGDEVGFQIRFSDVSNSNTAIKFMTDGVLLRECLIHKDMKPYSVIVLDEAHERSLHTDILFGVLRQLLVTKANPNLKVLVASATLNTEQFCKYFLNCPHFAIPGRCYPVEIIHAETTQKYYVEAAVTRVLEIHTKQPMGAILVFLTGQEQIEEAIKGLTRRVDALYEDGVDMPDIVILPAYANLPADQVQKIFAPCPPDVRKVVFATNIAETSLTVDGVVYVVDPGYVKQRIFNPQTGIDALTVVPISKVAAIQRAGRAGRTCPGKCYRLYTEKVYQDNLPDVTVPEIQRTNLANTVLMLKSLGIDDPIQFEFLDNPSVQTLVEALELLYQLDAITADGAITKLGSAMVNFPLEPTLSKLLLTSLAMGCHEEMLTITAMLSAEDLWIRPPSKDARVTADERREQFSSAFGDHITYLLIYDLWQNQGCDAKWCNDNFIHHKVLLKAREIRGQLAQILSTHREEIGDTTKDSRRPDREGARVQQRVDVKRRKGEDEFGREERGGNGNAREERGGVNKRSKSPPARWRPKEEENKRGGGGGGKRRSRSRSDSRSKDRKGSSNSKKDNDNKQHRGGSRRSRSRSASRERRGGKGSPARRSTSTKRSRSKEPAKPAVEEDVITSCRKCIAQCFFAHTARKQSDQGAYKPYNEQSGVLERGGQLLFLHPTSSLRASTPKWVVYHEVVYTTKPFMKNVCAIEFDWVAEWLPRLTNTSARRLVGKTSAGTLDHKLDALAPAIERLPKAKKEEIHTNVEDAKARYLARKKDKEKPGS